MTVIERDEPWWEPDGTPTTSGPHPHYALWDHEGRKWDRLTDGVVLAGAERDALLAEVDWLSAEVEWMKSNQPGDLRQMYAEARAATERARIRADMKGVRLRGTDAEGVTVVRLMDVLDIVEDRP